MAHSEGVFAGVQKSSRSLMDKMLVCGTSAPGSIPGESTIEKSASAGFLCALTEQSRGLFAAQSKDGAIEMSLQDMFWGAYYGSCTDRFEVRRMFNCEEKAS